MAQLLRCCYSISSSIIMLEEKIETTIINFCFVFWIFGCGPMAVWLKDLLDGNIITLKNFGPYHSC